MPCLICSGDEEPYQPPTSIASVVCVAQDVVRLHAEEPEAAELDALRGRKEAAELDGPKDLVALLDNKNASVLIGAANALFNLALDPPNADALLPLGALPKLAAHLEHEDDEVKASMAGVLMNICATSLSCRTELAVTRLLPALLKAIVDAMRLGAGIASGSAVWDEELAHVVSPALFAYEHGRLSGGGGSSGRRRKVCKTRFCANASKSAAWRQLRTHL